MDWKNKDIIRLVQAILSIESKEEAARFLRDLMTEKEILEFSKRLRAAEMLTAKNPYTMIEEETKLSSTTIARVAKWLNSKEGGYKTIIKKLHHQDNLQIQGGLS